MECYICDAKYVFLEDTGYIYRKNDTSVSWQYRPDSTQNWFKLANELKGWIEKKNKDPNKYASLTRYLIFFAVFFDSKMEYVQRRKSVFSIRKILKRYHRDELGREAFKKLSDRKHALPIQYMALAVGIRFLIESKIDERFSDTGIKEEQ